MSIDYLAMPKNTIMNCWENHILICTGKLNNLFIVFLMLKNLLVIKNTTINEMFCMLKVCVISMIKLLKIIILVS